MIDDFLTGFLIGLAFYYVIDLIIDRVLDKIRIHRVKKSDKGLNIKKDKE